VNKIPPQYLGNTGQKSKIGPVSLDHRVAQSPTPSDTTGHAETRINISTYFTSVPGVGDPPAVLYNGDRIWTRVRVTLLTAGPVAVGQLANLFPVLGGAGQLLQPGVPTTFDIAKGNKLYIAANSVNRVSLTVEPYPWLETLTGLLTSLVAAVRGAPSAVKSIASKVG
jgi:hypothetical protein